MLSVASRWRAPAALTVLTLAASGSLADALAGGDLNAHPVTFIVTVLSGYAVGSVATPAVAAAAALAASATLTWANQIAAPGEFPLLDDLVYFLLVVGAPTIAGAVLRSRSRHVRELRRLTALLAQQREREVCLARLEERNRIEVHLHRNFCEQVAAIVLRTEGAIAGSAEEAGAALSDVEDTARSTLDQLREALGTLNDSDETAAPAVEELVELPAPDEPGPNWRDVTVAGFCAVAMGVEGVVSPEAHGAPWLNVALAAVAATPLAMRRNNPIMTACALVAAYVIMARLTTPPPVMVTTLVPLVIVAYAIGAHSDRWWRLVGFAVMAVSLVAAVLASPAIDGDSASIPPPLVGCVLAGAMGIVTAGWSARAQRHRHVLESLVIGRDADVRLAIAEERAAVARDLHDSVAHAMTVVCLQAAAGRVSPDEAALETILATARRGLEELRDGLGSLGDGVGLDAASISTQARTAGLYADVCVSGDPSSVSGAALELAWRVLREAIVNAGRYAPGAHVTIVVDTQSPLVRLDVVDAGCANPEPWRGGAGRGLNGLADDLARVGGSLEWGPNLVGGFRVSAQVPS